MSQSTEHGACRFLAGVAKLPVRVDAAVVVAVAGRSYSARGMLRKPARAGRWNVPMVDESR